MAGIIHRWKDNKFGIVSTQTILIKIGNIFKLSAVKSINNDVVISVNE